MDRSNGGSFIPKRNSNKPVARMGRRVYIFSYVAYVIFFGTLMSVVGVFIINQQTEKKLNGFVASVAERQTSFKQEDIDALLALEDQLNSAGTLLDQHASPLKVFSELEKNILEKVQLISFNYTRADPTKISISMEAQAKDFDQALIQRETFANSQIFEDLEVAEVLYGETAELEGESISDFPSANFASAFGLITFKIEGAITLGDIAYQTTQTTPRSDSRSTTTAGLIDDNPEVIIQ